jgi:hypothetical protein
MLMTHRQYSHSILREIPKSLETEPWDRLGHRYEAKAAGKRLLPGPNATALVLYPTRCAIACAGKE